MTLQQIFRNHAGRLSFKWNHYPDIYERHFSRFVDTLVTVFEIGVASGGSLQVWKKYFGPQAKIIGVDIAEACQFCEDQIIVEVGSQNDVEFLDCLVRTYGKPNIVIDDGSHYQNDILATFDYLYPRMADNGVYLVEDLHTSYWDGYGGGLQKDGTAIERFKSLIDELNADHTKGALLPNDFTRTTTSISFYDSVTVFEKRRSDPKHTIYYGKTA